MELGGQRSNVYLAQQQYLVLNRFRFARPNTDLDRTPQQQLSVVANFRRVRAQNPFDLASVTEFDRGVDEYSCARVTRRFERLGPSRAEFNTDRLPPIHDTYG